MNEAEIRALMWKSVGLFRDRESLREAVDQLQEQEAALEGAPRRATRSLDHEGWRRASIVTVAALDRQGRAATRGKPRRPLQDRFPAPDDLNWKTHISDVMHPR